MKSSAVDSSHDHRTPRARILVLTTSYPSEDGDPTGVFIAHLLGAIKRRGYVIKVVAPSDGTFHGRRELDGIETVRFGYFRPRSLERLTRPGGGIPENMARSLLARVQVLPMMAMFVWVCLSEIRGSDIIYANWLGAGIIGAIANFFTRKPLVVSFRGDDGYLARERFLWRILTKWVARRSSIVAPVSGDLLHILLDLGVPEGKCRLPRFGVDTQLFYPPAEPRKAGEEVKLLFVGSLIGRKGIRDLLLTLAHPSLEMVHLTVVGDGMDKPELLEMSRRSDMEERIEWRGFLPPAEVARLMRISDALCLPSYMEGRPNVVNEAMASGLPVIAARVGGIPDMVIEGETAFLFTPGNVTELLGCLVTLVSDPQLRIRMGRAGHEFLVRSGVSWDTTAEEFDVLFSGLVNDTRK